MSAGDGIWAPGDGCNQSRGGTVLPRVILSGAAAESKDLIWKGGDSSTRLWLAQNDKACSSERRGQDPALPLVRKGEILRRRFGAVFFYAQRAVSFQFRKKLYAPVSEKPGGLDGGGQKPYNKDEKPEFLPNLAKKSGRGNEEKVCFRFWWWMTIKTPAF